MNCCSPVKCQGPDWKASKDAGLPAYLFLQPKDMLSNHGRLQPWNNPVKPASNATGMCTASPACSKTCAQLLQAQAGMMAGLNRQQRHELYRQVSDNTLAHMLAAMRSQERTKLLREVEEVDQALVDRVLRYIRCSCTAQVMHLHDLVEHNVGQTQPQPCKSLDLHTTPNLYLVHGATATQTL